MVDITALLANAGKTDADFNFGKLNTAYWEGLDQAYKKETRDVFKDPSLYNKDGSIDPSKAFTRALQVGGLPGVESAAKAGESGINLEQQQQFNNLYNRIYGGGKPPTDDGAGNRGDTPSTALPYNVAPSLNSPSANKPVAPPASETGRPQQQSGTLLSFFAANGLQPDPDIISGISNEITARTRKPFDPRAPLDLNDPNVRAVLTPYARGGRGQPQAPAPQPQVAPQVGAAPAAPALGGTPQTAQEAIAARFPLGGGGTPPPQAPGSALPLQPQPVQTAQAQPSPPPVQSQRRAVPPPAPSRDETLNGLISPHLLKAGGGTARGALELLDMMAATAPAARRPAIEAQASAIRSALQPTETEKISRAAGVPVSDYIDRQEKAKAVQSVLDKTMPLIVSSYQEAKSNTNAIQGIHRARTLLDSPGGVITGQWSDDRLTLMKIGSLFGMQDTNKIANTEAFTSEMSKRILDAASSMPGSLSDKDVRFLGSVGGTSKLDEKSLRQMLDLAEKVSRQKIQLHNSQLDQAANASDAVKGFKQYYTVGEPGTYQAPARARSGALPQFGTSADVDRAVAAKQLQRGDYFLDANGKRRQVP